MELLAAIRALEALKRPCEVTLTTDSVMCATASPSGSFAWQKNGWRTADKKPVKNSELWQELLEAARPHKVQWKWVKGHAGHPENERADKLACDAALQFVNRSAR
jgi:ribonuclease HI